MFNLCLIHFEKQQDSALFTSVSRTFSCSLARPFLRVSPLLIEYWRMKRSYIKRVEREWRLRVMEYTGLVIRSENSHRVLWVKVVWLTKIIMRQHAYYVLFRLMLNYYFKYIEKCFNESLYMIHFFSLFHRWCSSTYTKTMFYHRDLPRNNRENTFVDKIHMASYILTTLWISKKEFWNGIILLIKY